MGTSAVLKATILPIDTTEELTWESSDPAIVEVDNGAVKALKVGISTITAKIGKLTATCVVTVVESAEEV